MIKYIVEDSSFVVSVMNHSDKLHELVLSLFRKIINVSYQTRVKVVISTTTFYESLFVLIKSGMDSRAAKLKLNNLMIIDSVINHVISETSILKMASSAQRLIESNPQKTSLRSHDLMLLTVAMEYENSCFLTGDRGMLDYKIIYPNIFCFTHEQKRLLDFLEKE